MKRLRRNQLIIRQINITKIFLLFDAIFPMLGDKIIFKGTKVDRINLQAANFQAYIQEEMLRFGGKSPLSIGNWFVPGLACLLFSIAGGITAVSNRPRTRRLKTRGNVETMIWLEPGVHHGVNEFARGASDINGIESFWVFAKLRLTKRKGNPAHTFYPQLKETKFRFNYRHGNPYLKTLRILHNNPLQLLKTLFFLVFADNAQRRTIYRELRATVEFNEKSLFSWSSTNELY